MKTLYPIRMKYMFVLSFLLMSFMPSTIITSFAAESSSPAPVFLYGDDELDEAKKDLMNMIYECMKVLEDSHQALSEKATSDEAPELYQQVDEMAKRLDYARYQLEQVASIEELQDLQTMVSDIRKRLEELRYQIEEFVAAKTFTATTIEGIEMTFKVISEEDKTCQVWRPESNNFDAPVAIDKATMGQVTIPETANDYRVVSICDEAFYYCPSITSVIIPTSVLEIGERAFCGCKSLAQINLPETLKSIGSATFYGTAVSSVVIPASVRSIGSVPYGECPNLTKIEVASGNTFFDTRDNCNAIISTQNNSLIQGCHTTSIPSGVVSIGWMAFKGCSGMENLFIPKTVQSISSTAFELCGGLKSIVVEDGNPVYDSRNNCNAIIYTPSNTLVVGCQNTVIPEDIVAIGENAFMGCQNLKEILLPKSVKSIGGHAFEDCKSLESVVIPEGVTTISYMAFYGCSGLKSVSIPESATSIGFCSFDGCSSLTEVVIPDYVTSLGNQAFMGCSSLEKVTLGAGITKMNYASFLYCDNLRTIISYIQEPFALQSGVFDYNKGTTLYVPFGTKAKYEATDGWNKFANIVEMEESDDVIIFADVNVKAICVENWDTNGDGKLSYDEAAAVTELGQVFRDNHDITSFDELQYFTGLTEIPEFAFFSCEALSSVVIPNSVTAVGAYAFAHSGLQSITIPTRVTSIGQSALWACEDLTSIVVEKENTVYDSRDNCNAIIITASNELKLGCRNTVIPTTVTAIGREAFNGHAGLQTITIPNSVRSIKIGAFNQCFGMMSVTIPSSVVSIESNAFRACSGLRVVRTFIEDPFPIDESVFEGEYDTAFLYVPTGSKSKYASTPGWNKFQNIVEGNPEDERQLMVSKEVGGVIYTIFKEVADRDDFRVNPDGWELYRTKVTLDITTNGVTDTYLLDDALYGEVNSDSQIPCMMFDLQNRMMYAFCLSKGEDVYYGMEGYVYSSPMDVVNFQKEQVFTYANWGWWTSFAGMNNGQPQLSHFSFAGYYRMTSVRNDDGSWATDYVEQIYPDDYKRYWQSQDIMLVVGQPADIDPLEKGEEVDFGENSELTEETDLGGVIADNMYFNIPNDKGRYEPVEGCIVITSSTSDEDMAAIEGKEFFDKDLMDHFAGFIFKVPAGQGNIRITAETTGDMTLRVKIGDDDPIEKQLDGRRKVSIPYNVFEETLVYVYAGQNASVKGVGPVTASSGELKIYSIEREDLPTDIANVGIGSSDVTIYSLSGQRLTKPQKGVNIVGGKKVVVK